MPTTSPPREIIRNGENGPERVPYKPRWLPYALQVVLGAAWLGICITALIVLLTLADAWVKGG